MVVMAEGRCVSAEGTGGAVQSGDFTVTVSVMLNALVSTAEDASEDGVGALDVLGVGVVAVSRSVTVTESARSSAEAADASVTDAVGTSAEAAETGSVAEAKAGSVTLSVRGRSGAVRSAAGVAG